MAVAGDLLLGVDGGGSKTRALVSDLTGKVLAWGAGPASNYHVVGLESAVQAIATATDEALRALPETQDGPSTARGRVVASCFGLSGGDRPSDLELIAGAIQKEGIVRRFTVVHDAELVLAAGTPENWGVAVISGTGSACFGRARDGRTARAGGWGHLFGDEGSGYDLALRALRLASQTADGRADAKALLEALLARWDLRTPEDLLTHVFLRPEVTPSYIARLAETVLVLAGQGNAHARQLVDEAASALASHIRAVAGRLGLTHAPVAFAGGLLTGSEDLRRGVIAKLDENLGPFSAVEDPALGALKIAATLLEA